MTWLAASIKWIMLVSGVLTCTIFYAAFAPEAALKSTFGESFEIGPVSGIIVRNWGVLVGLVGAMLIYGAFVSAARGLVLTVASVSKLAFIGLVLSHGLGSKAILPITIDLIVTALYVMYLLELRRRKATA